MPSKGMQTGRGHRSQSLLREAPLFRSVIVSKILPRRASSRRSATGSRCSYRNVSPLGRLSARFHRRNEASGACSITRRTKPAARQKQKEPSSARSNVGEDRLEKNHQGVGREASPDLMPVAV